MFHVKHSPFLFLSLLPFFDSFFLSTVFVYDSVHNFAHYPHLVGKSILPSSVSRGTFCMESSVEIWLFELFYQAIG